MQSLEALRNEEHVWTTYLTDTHGHKVKQRGQRQRSDNVGAFWNSSNVSAGL